MILFFTFFIVAIFVSIKTKSTHSFVVILYLTLMYYGLFLLEVVNGNTQYLVSDEWRYFYYSKIYVLTEGVDRYYGTILIIFLLVMIYSEKYLLK